MRSITYPQFFRLCLNHMGDLPKIEAAVAGLVGAVNCETRLVATQAVCESLKPLAHDFDELNEAQTNEVHSLADAQSHFEAQAVAAGWNGERVKKFLEVVGNNLPLILQILNGVLAAA